MGNAVSVPKPYLFAACCLIGGAMEAGLIEGFFRVNRSRSLQALREVPPGERGERWVWVSTAIGLIEVRVKLDPYDRMLIEYLLLEQADRLEGEL